MRVDLAKLLTNQISMAPTLEAVQRLAADNGPNLDAIHAAALLMRAAQLSAPWMAAVAAAPAGASSSTAAATQPAHGGKASNSEALAALAQVAASRMGSFDGTTACCALYALAKLGYTSDPTLTEALAQVVGKHRARCSPAQLTTSLWALAKLGWWPEDAWLAGHLAACQALMAAGQLPMQDLSLLLYALAVIGVPPPAPWLDAWQGAVVAALPGAKPQDLSNALWALAALELQPSEACSHALLGAFEAHAGDASAQGLANAVWAVARLGLQPSDAWVAAFLEAAQARMQVVTPQAFATTLASLARMRRPLLVAPWLGGMLRRSLPTLREFKPLELSNTLLALAQLGPAPEREWLEAALQAAAPHLRPEGGFTGVQLCNMLWSLALLQCAPPAQWLDSALAALLPRLPSLRPPALAGMAWSLGRLGHAPPPAWLDAYLDQAFGRLLGADTAAFANTLFCVASLDMEHLQVGLGYCGGCGEKAAGWRLKGCWVVVGGMHGMAWRVRVRPLVSM